MAETATPTYPSEDPTSTNAPSGAANLGDAHATATDALPSPETQRKVANHTVLDRHGKEHLFKSLYSGDAARVLVIFVRHFFCGSCQDFLSNLSQSIKPDDLSRLPTSTSIVIVGCGDPALIDMYATDTGCPFPVYSDPTRKLYDELGMTRSLAQGSRPSYIRRSFVSIVGQSIMQALRQIPNGLATKGGPSNQIGGEFLFEVRVEGAEGGERGVTWCHRMENTRDHTEVADLAHLLDLRGD